MDKEVLKDQAIGKVKSWHHSNSNSEKQLGKLNRNKCEQICEEMVEDKKRRKKKALLKH